MKFFNSLLPQKLVVVLGWQRSGVERVLGNVFEAADAIRLQSEGRVLLLVAKRTKVALDHLRHAEGHLVPRPVSFFLLFASLSPLVPL